MIVPVILRRPKNVQDHYVRRLSKIIVIVIVINNAQRFGQTNKSTDKKKYTHDDD